MIAIVKYILRLCNHAVMMVIVCASTSLKPAYACSPSSDYMMPTNLEMVEMADTVIIGEVLFRAV